MKKYILHVSGTHCASCKILIEEILTEQKEISKAVVDLHKQTVEIEVDNDQTPESLVRQLNPLLEAHKYSLSLEKQQAKKDYQALSKAAPIGLAVLFLFFLLQKSGLINFGFEGGLNAWTAFLVGLIASVSTCLAVVGGLILSLSAQASKDSVNTRPFILFHSGRVIGFAVLGAILGMLGGILSINQNVTATLGVLASLVMIILGINLLEVFQFTKKLQISLPKSIFRNLIKLEKGIAAPLLIGVATFFLPCGFTQSMQVAALASGSWTQGAMIMLMFALGTLPMLVLISFSSYKFANSRFAPIFYKAAGIVVIGLGVFSLITGLAGIGIIKPIFNI